jgi:hypothetical protein
MIERFAGFRPRPRFLIGTAVIVLGAIAINFYADRQGLSYKEVIVALGALIAAVIIFGGERGIRFGFVLWVLTLALGYRTVEWTANLRIHPSEILLWLLLLCIFAQRRLVSTSKLTFPFWIWLLLPFWVLAWWPLIAGNTPWDKMFAEFRDFLLVIPLIIVASVVLKQKRYWRYLLVAFFVASTWIALMGVIEYWFPEVGKLFPSFVTHPTAVAAADSFERAQFSFWGGAVATFICLLALPFSLVLGTWWPGWFQRAAIAAASVLQMLAIYVGGYRSIWLVLLIQVLIACVLRLKKHGFVVALLCLVVAAGGYQVIPKTSERVSSGIAVLRGQPIDHSAEDRKDRALGALNQVIEAPLGSGWSSAGWVHSDFLQVAANLGIIAGLIFLGGYLNTLVRLGRRVLLRAAEHEDLGLALLLSFVAAGGLLLMEGVEVLPQLVLPMWFVWVLVEVWLRQTVAVPEFNNVATVSYAHQWLPVQSLSRLKTDV